jgi:hypothetical protein
MPRRVKYKVAPRLYVHGVTVEQWTARYGVEPFTTHCPDCGAPMTTSRPFVQGTLRGLEAPRCPCWPPENPDPNVVQSWPPFALVRDPKYGDLFDGDLNS